MPRLIRSAILAASVAALLAIPGTASPAPPLKLIGTETLKVSGETEKDEAKTSIFVVNEGTDDATLSVKFMSSKPMGISANPGSFPVPAGDVASVPVILTGLKALKQKVSGVLVVTGGATPLARQVEVTPALNPAHKWRRDIVGLAFVAAALLGLVSVVWVIGKAGLTRLFAHAPGPKWSLDSWATTLTAAGAVFGTVLGSATLPDVPKQVDKDTLVTLNLFFGLLLVAGPFLFQALRRPTASPLDQESGASGTNLTLVLASCVIFAAVAGEIATLGLVFWEILDGGWRDLALWSTVVAEVLAAFYFLLTIPRVAASDWKELAKKAKLAAAKDERRRMKEFARILRDELSPDEAVQQFRYLPDDTTALIGPEAERPSVAATPRWSLP